MNDDELDGLLDSIDGLAELLDVWVDQEIDDQELQLALEQYSDVLPVALDAPPTEPTIPRHVPSGLCAVFPDDAYAPSCTAPRPWMGRAPRRMPQPSRPARSFSNDVAELREAQARIEHAFSRVAELGIFTSPRNL